MLSKISIIAMVVTLTISTVNAQTDTLKASPLSAPKPVEIDSPVSIKGQQVTALIYANSLIREGREEGNPMKIGLAAVAYFAMGFNRDFATQLLDEATKLAIENGDVETLKWLADIWADPIAGANNPTKSEDCLARVKVLTSTGKAFSGTKKRNLLVPSEYFNK